MRSRGENCTIHLRFNISATLKLRSATGFKINSDKWSFSKKSGKEVDNGRPIQNTNIHLSARLNSLSSYLENAYTRDYGKSIRYDSAWLKTELDLFFKRQPKNNAKKIDDNIFLNYLDNFIEYRELKGGTKKSTERKFNQLRTKFSDYDWQRKVLISDIDSRFILTFKKYMMNDLKHMESTANEIIRKLKTVLLNARNEDDKIVSNSINSLKVNATPAVKVFLSFDEIEKIKNCNIIGSNLQHAKDFLIIGCFVGQRVSDLLRMNKTMIHTVTDHLGDSYQLIRLRQEKTNTDVSIPLIDEVQNILDKYKGEFPPTFGKVGESRSVLFNRYIKKVCELAGIDNIVLGRIWDKESKRNIIKETEKYKLITSHVCRRSFATNYYGDNRFTTAEIMSITGHKSEETFLAYCGKTREQHALKSARTFRQIEELKKQVQ